jgi:hypothetical protein
MERASLARPTSMAKRRMGEWANGRQGEGADGRRGEGAKGRFEARSADKNLA